MVCLREENLAAGSGVTGGMSMGDVFLELFDRGMSAGWMILAVILFRAAFRGMPKWVRCMLWGCVAIRLVCPFSIESPVSLVPGADVLHSVVVSGSAADRPVDGITGVGDVMSPVLESSSVNPAPDNAVRSITWAEAAGIVWCIGVFIMLCSAAVSSIRVRHTVREAVRDRNDIYFCDAIKTPFIQGFIRPHIYLPSGLDAAEMRHVLAHEEAHLKRRDQLWKPLGFLLLTVYWFQPVCGLAYILFCRDIELACDEKVIRGLSFDERQDYSRALVSCGQQRRLVSVCPLAFGEVGVKERVKEILNYRKPGRWIVAVALIGCAVIAVCFWTNRPATNPVEGTAGEERAPESSEAMTENVTDSLLEEPYVIKTYEVTPMEELDGNRQDGVETVYVPYYEMSDGTWATADYSYKYRLEISGDPRGSSTMIITYVVLSNTQEITFGQALMASGLSSNLDDYFAPEESVIVGVIWGLQN